MQTLRILDLLEGCCLQLDAYTYICLLHGCMKQGVVSQGRSVHSHIIKIGFRCNMFLWTTIIDMYVQSGALDEAKVVFDYMPDHINLASCNVMIGGYVKQGHPRKATQILNHMLEGGVKPNNVTIINMIQACSVSSDIDGGRSLHCHALYENFWLNTLLENALIAMYAKCGNLDDSHRTFRRMIKQDAVSWNTIIHAYAIFGYAQTSLQLFQEMQGKGVLPDDVTFLSVLNACADLGSLEMGMETHLLVSKRGVDCLMELENAIVDLYGKCGDMKSATQVFRDGHRGDDVSRNSLISGFAQSGNDDKVLELWLQGEDKLNLDVVAIIGVLSACSHTGIVDFGCHLFQHLTKMCPYLLAEEHHICMIDLFGRAGSLEGALAFVEAMPCQPLPTAWRALLGACRVHHDVSKAQEAVKAVIETDPDSVAAKILLSNTHIASSARREQASGAR